MLTFAISASRESYFARVLDTSPSSPLVCLFSERGLYPTKSSTIVTPKQKNNNFQVASVLVTYGCFKKMTVDLVTSNNAGLSSYSSGGWKPEMGLTGYNHGVSRAGPFRRLSGKNQFPCLLRLREAPTFLGSWLPFWVFKTSVFLTLLLWPHLPLSQPLLPPSHRILVM